jgi:hypothetical protein
MREIKVSVRERAEREHGGAVSETTQERHGIHRKGSARASYAAGDPTTVPDGDSTRALNSTDDDGRLHVDATTKQLRVYDGSAWGAVQVAGVHLKLINIGTWNMDTNSGVDVAHGLTLSKIVGVRIIIRSDTDNAHYPIDYASSTGHSNGGANLDSTNVQLYRTASGSFDSANFDTMGGDGNRGFILIWYTD